jgi:cytochrome c oxidase subunit 4
MTDSHQPPADGHGDQHHGPNVQAYFMVFGALCVCTLLSFVFNYAARAEAITVYMSFALIMAVAVIKATLVGTYFMHLKYDWSKVRVMIIPALVLGPMMMVVLLPDIVLAWRAVTAP